MAIRVVVVGLGPRGRDWLHEIQTAPGYELVACVDIDPAALTQTSGFQISPERCFAELEEALDKTACDAVVVATSVDSHGGPCELALARGLAVLVEKPFTLSPGEAVRLVSLAEQKSVPLVVAQNYRYMRSFRTARRLVSAGALGPVGMVVCQYYRVPQAMSASLAHLTNSALWGAGIHHLDVMRYILQRRVTGVLAESFTLPWGQLPNGGSMQLMLSLEDQARALYSATYESTGHEFFERGQEFYMRFVGERATLHVSLSANRFVNTTPDNQRNLKELTAACIEGMRLRGALAERLISETQPRLSLMVFPELHHAGHQMWHTIDPGVKVYSGRELNGGRALAPLLRDVYRAMDREIARLIGAVGSEATVMVFALHGMRPALGFPAFLGPLLCERGFSRQAALRSQSWTKRSLSLFAAIKRHTPEGLKKLYYKLTPQAATHKLARPTMLPVHDWANTRAFSLPTDQYGWIRINLVGREAQGSVPLDQYEETCQQLETMLLGLTTEDGQLLVEDITRTAADAKSALNNPLPDLVLHWRDAAFIWPLKIRDSKVQVEFVGKKSTGQHASEGFCIYRGDRDLGPGNVVAAKDLGRLMTAGL